MKKIIFFKSLKKVKLNILLLMLVDFIPYLLAFLGYALIARNISYKLSGLPSSVNFMSLEQLNSLLSTLYSFIAYILILSLALIAARALTKGYVYSRTINKQFSFEFYKKFLLLNLAWTIPWIIVFFALFKAIKPELFVYIIPVLIFLWIHFTTILFALFTQENKLNTVKTALKLGIKKSHRFILPYLAVMGAIAALVFILLIGLFLAAFIEMPETLMAATYIILIAATFLFAFAFARIYIVDVIHSILKKED